MRILLILTTTIAALIGCLVLLVGLALHHLKAADREADGQWERAHQLAAAPARPQPSRFPESQPAAASRPAVVAAPVRQTPIILFAIDARLRGKTLWKSDGEIGNWKDVNAYVEWPMTANAGKYAVELVYSLGAGPRKVTVEVAGQTLNKTTASTGSWGHFITAGIGTVSLPAGDTILRVKPTPGSTLDDALMHLRAVYLVPPGTTVADPTAVTITLSAANAELHGERIKRSEEAEPKIVSWISPGDFAEWSFKSPVRQNYRAQLTLSDAPTTGGDFDLSIGREVIHCHAGSTGDFSTPRTVPLGIISIPAGRVSIDIKPVGEFHNALMNLWKVEFFPVGE
ncbi:MAG TPA: hypothetical protein VFE47_28795 [Tepidisphaeraceae bacterium]|jgi:hypothetical protein|nr:hypothetical protein [Tepidisphaeraceae bacterium]